MYTRPLPTQERLKEVLRYYPETGAFRWIKPRYTRWHMKVAGTITQRGYRAIRVDGMKYQAHRLAWKYIYGEDPVVIDHKNRNKLDNRIANLHNGTQMDNIINTGFRKDNKSGIIGVALKGSRWVCLINSSGKGYYMGSYHCKALAGITYMLAKARRDAGLPVKPKGYNESI